MTEPTDHAPTEPPEGIDASANADARDREQNQSQPLARASGEGPPPTDAPLTGEAPVVEGTGAGDALQGVRIDDDDAANAVGGDDGPEHGDVRRQT